MTEGRPSSTVDAVADEVPVSAVSRIVHLDALRAAAVMLVVVMHAGLPILPGDGGVVIFFTVSGYIITSLVIKERQRTGGFAIRSFYARRLLKLGPPLAVLVVIPTCVYAIFRPVSWGALASQVGFSYNWVQLTDYPASLHVLPGSEVVWSLAIEEQFYIGFAVLWLAALHVRRWSALLAGVCGALIVYSLGTRIWLCIGQPSSFEDWETERYQHLWRGTDTRIEAIAIGVLLALAFEQHRQGRLKRMAALGSDVVLVLAAVLFVGASLFFREAWSEGTMRPTAQAWCAALLIAYGLLPRPTRCKHAFYRLAGLRAVQQVGLASYSIYLAHEPVMRLVTSMSSGAPDLAVFALNIVLGTSVGLLAYRLVEIPALRLKSRLLATQ